MHESEKSKTNALEKISATSLWWAIPATSIYCIAGAIDYFMHLFPRKSDMYITTKFNEKTAKENQGYDF